MMNHITIAARVAPTAGVMYTESNPNQHNRLNANLSFVVLKDIAQLICGVLLIIIAISAKCAK